MTSHSRPFSADVRIIDRVAVIDLHGEINGAAESVLDEAHHAADAASPEAIVLSFADVSYINSTGIALIVGVLAETRKSKRRLVTCGLNEHYTEIFRITRLSDFMAMLPDEAAALTAVQNE